MMKIAFVQGGFSSVGGIESFAVDLVSALNQRHVAIELICWNASSGENSLLREVSTSGVPVHCTKWRWGCRWGVPDRFMAHKQWNRLAEADLLVFGKLLDANIHFKLYRLAKRMILVTPYRPSEMWGETRPNTTVLNSFESIVVQAASFQDDLRFFGYRGKVFTLPYLPPEVYEPAPWPATQVLQIGFLGRLVPDKNVQYLIQAFSHLRTAGMDARLNIFGDGPERKKLQSLTSEMGLNQYIQFHGRKDRTGIPGAIDQCHLFAFSSKTEGQCLAALEILARGRPVVGTPVGVFPDLLSGVRGCVAPLGAPEAFAHALSATARPIIAGKITPADIQRDYLRRFNRERVIDDYIQLFGCRVREAGIA